jgi:hypothetical protein
MARFTLALLLLAGCYDSHRLGFGLDDGVHDAGPRDFGRPGRDLGPPRRDLGPPRADAGTTCDECVAEVIEWGPDGGLVFERTWWQLSPCDRILQRTDFGDGAPPALCSATLGELDCGILGFLEAVVDSPAVRMLRDAAPIVVGSDPRPVDGQILGLIIGGDSIGVGGECGPDPDCLPVPPEVHELATLLDRISEGLSEPGACQPLAETETFQCGEGPGASTCVTGRDVCYLDRFDAPRCAVPSGEEDMCSGAPHCDCLLLSLAETCVEGDDGEVTVRWVGP